MSQLKMRNLEYTCV